MTRDLRAGLANTIERMRSEAKHEENEAFRQAGGWGFARTSEALARWSFVLEGQLRALAASPVTALAPVCTCPIPEDGISDTRCPVHFEQRPATAGEGQPTVDYGTGSGKIIEQEKNA